MSKDEKDSGKEFTFIKEQIIPKKRNRMKKFVLGLVTTVIFAAVFGIVSRIVFVESEAFVNHILGIKSSNGQEDKVTQNNGQSIQESTLEASQENVQSNDSTLDNTKEEDTTTNIVQGTKIEQNEDKMGEQTQEITQEISPEYTEQKIAPTLNDVETIYSEYRKLAMKTSQSIVTVTSIEETVDLLHNPCEIENLLPGLVIKNDEREILILVDYAQIKGAKELTITFSGNIKAKAKILQYDESTNLAVVSVDSRDLSDFTIKNTKVATLGESYNLINGTPVFALGSPNGLMNSLDFGIVTNCSGVAYITDMKLDLFYTNIVTAENGLGYIFNLEGEVVGIITHSSIKKVEPKICTVIGISRIRKIINRMIAGSEHILFGVVAEDMKSCDLEDAGIHYGVYVSEVVSKSPAYTAGIQAGDIIETLNGQPVGSINTFTNFLDSFHYKDEITVGIVRYSKETPVKKELALTIGKVN